MRMDFNFEGDNIFRSEFTTVEDAIMFSETEPFRDAYMQDYYERRSSNPMSEEEIDERIEMGQGE